MSRQSYEEIKRANDEQNHHLTWFTLWLDSVVALHPVIHEADEFELRKMIRNMGEFEPFANGLLSMSAGLISPTEVPLRARWYWKQAIQRRDAANRRRERGR
jgi:hypothetical protein